MNRGIQKHNAHRSNRFKDLSYLIGEPLRFTEAMRFIQRSLPAELYRRIKNNAGLLLSNAEPSVFV